MSGRRWPWIVVVALVLAFLFTPALVVVLFAFNSSTSTSALDGLSLRWFDHVFADPEFTQALTNTLTAAAWTAAFDVLAGTAAALALTRLPRRWLTTLSSLFMVPVIVPGLLIGVALLAFFSRLHVTLAMPTVVVGHVVVTLPLVVVIVATRLERLDLSVVEAARDLGASAFTAFRRVLLPLIAPALAGSVLLAVAWSFDEFIITLFTNGGTPTVPILIFTQLRRGLDPSVNAVATLLLAGTTLMSVLAARTVSLRDLAR
jgi:ABC-type spermidine/putrescine transport system permease subunit II